MKNVRNLFSLLVIAVSLGSCAEDAVFEELEDQTAPVNEKSANNEGNAELESGQKTIRTYLTIPSITGE